MITGIGKIIFENIEGGIWGIEIDQIVYQPLDFPEELQTEGIEIECQLKETDDMHFGMFGVPVKIISFSLKS